MEIVFVEYLRTREEVFPLSDLLSARGVWKLTHNDQEIEIEEWINTDKEGEQHLEEDVPFIGFAGRYVAELESIIGVNLSELKGLRPALWESYATKKTVGFHF